MEIASLAIGFFKASASALASAAASATLAVTGSAATAAAVGNFALGALGVGGAGTVAGWIGAQAGQAAALALLQRALVGKPQLPDPLQQVTFLPDPQAPRQVVFGRAPVSGSAVMATTHGSGKHNNMLLTYVVPFSGFGPIDSVEKIYLEDQEATFNGNGDPVVAPGGPGDTSRLPGRLTNTQWENFVFYQHKKGEWNQTAIQFDQYPGEIPQWTSLHKGSGVAHYAITYWMEPQKFPSGAPAPKLIVRGSKLLINPVDLSVGYSANPADVVYTLLRGIVSPSGARLGAGLSEEWIDRPAYAAWRAVCVANNWTMGGVYRVNADNLFEFLKGAFQAGGAAFCVREGRASVAFYSPKPVVHSIKETDLSGPPVETHLVDRKARVSRIVPKCWSPANGWEFLETEPVSDATFLAQDGGRLASAEMDLPFCHNPTQARQIAAYDLIARRQPVLSFPAKPHMAGLGVDTVVSIDMEVEYGISWPRAIVVENNCSVAAGGDIRVRLEPAGMHTYALGLTATDAVIPSIPVEPDDTVPTPAGDATAVSVNLSSTGASIPAIRCNSALPSPGIVRCEFRLKPNGAADWSTSAAVVSANVAVDVGAVLTNSTYNVEARYVLQSGITGAWLALPNVSTGQLIADQAARVPWTGVTGTLYALMPNEKSRSAIPRIRALQDNAGSLVADASAVGVSSSAFSSALTALNSFLASKTTPVAWDNVTSHTDVTPGSGQSSFEEYLRSAETAFEALRTSVSSASRVYSVIQNAPPAADALNAAARVSRLAPIYPLTGPTASSINVATCTVSFVGRPNETYSSGTITGLTAATLYVVYRDRTSSTWIAVALASASSYEQNPVRYVRVGAQYTQVAGGGSWPSVPPPPALPGGGVDVDNIELV